MLDVKKVKEDFPILQRNINDNKLVYLDNAATSQKPKQVIKAVSDYYNKHNANVHRGIHTLSEEASELYEEARKNVSEFLGAIRPKELIFTSGTTESLNMVVFGWGMKNLKKDDVILISDTEHHSNLVPWQVLAVKLGVELVLVPVSQHPDSPLAPLIKEHINERVRIISIPHASNVTGAIADMKDIVKEAKKVQALVCIDGAQAAPHMSIDLKGMGCDFYALSAHKMLGPTGVGALWVKEDVMKDMEPVMFGGGMIREVLDQESSWAPEPEKFEAGTPNIAGVVGFSAAVDYLKAVGMENIREHELELNEYALKTLKEVEGISIIGPKDPKMRTGLVSFVIDKLHPHDLAAILDTKGIAVRSGHHCAMPLHKKLNVTASTRASYYLYNTKEDIDALAVGLDEAREILG